ncbi:MAG TPA: DNA helicase RecQ [Acetobacteraceae bacterium]|nr:DNA helicase RecQ [Acetobacteraceae bacterium]
MTPEQVLHDTFGFPAFRGLQAEAVHHLVDGGDALVLMPTGGGKSICYQLPAICREGTGLVVSPLIALMDDQVAALRQLGINAGALHSELEADENNRVSNLLASGKLDLLYVSPERLLSAGTLERLRRTKLALVAIDEAHCVSAWGHEFRPEYRELRRIAQIFPGVPRIALTATADPRTRDDILASLDMSGARVFTASFHRPNLHVAALAKTSESQQMLDFLKRHKNEAGIIYCGSRNKTERTAQRLQDKGITALAFHAGLSPLEKRAGLLRFRAGEPVVVVATIAFGMGIDRPDVRFVLHLDMPDSPEAYYQQIGRAGRDGDPAHALLLYGGEDMARARYWLSQSTAPEAQQRVMRQRLEAMIGLAEITSCRTRSLLACFGENMATPCGHCDNCRSPRALFDGTEAAQKVLSAIYRTGQMFGMRHVVDVLRGEKTDAVERNRHDKLALFGIGKEQTQDFWRGVVRQLIARGALRVKSGEYASLELVSDEARPILRGETQVMLAEAPKALPGEPPVPASRARAGKSPEPPPGSETLFESLRTWRMGVAKAQAVPPYVIFHDSVLRDIAAVCPASTAELGEIKGVGESKLQRYGTALLQIVQKHAVGA